MLILDAGMIAFAAFHALKGKVKWPLTFQIPRMVRALVAPLAEAYVLCWNSERFWKSELWPAYQANRPEIWELAGREDYEATIEVLAALGAVQFRGEGLESDEVLAGLVHRLRGREPIVIISDDKDFFQLLSGTVHMRGRVRGEVRWSDVKRILGVTPAYVTDFLALAGDPSDGIPRVVSPATARRLIETRGHVRRWMDRDLQVGAGVRQRLTEGRAQIAINLALVDLSRAAVEARGAPGEPILDGWGDLDRARAIGRRTGVAWLRDDDLAQGWAPLRTGGERARQILRV
jgi:5'-3' exonuclease